MLDLLFDRLDSQCQHLPTDASRLFHGRGHCYPELSFINVDWFDPLLWVVVYGEQPPPLMDQLRQRLIALAEAHTAIGCVMLQQRGRGRSHCETLLGSAPQPCYALEDGLRFELNLGANQNIGFFMDAKPGRQWLRSQASGKRVLNLFAYTCSFSLAALAGGAQSVVNIDMAKSTLAIGQRNHALNAIEPGRASFLPHDVFRSTRKLEDYGPYDLLVIDPPSRQKGSFEAEKDYGRLLKKLPPMLAEGAQILACLNAPYLDESFLPAQFAEHLPAFSLQQRLAQRDDFPEQDLQCCLKMQIFKA